MTDKIRNKDTIQLILDTYSINRNEREKKITRDALSPALDSIVLLNINGGENKSHLHDPNLLGFSFAVMFKNPRQLLK